MRFSLPSQIDDLAHYFSDFLGLVERQRWWRRAKQLYDEANSSPYQTKIMSDYHWLELELSRQIEIYRTKGHLLSAEIYPESMAALLFAGMTVETHKRLPSAGKRSLVGRLRDALKTGFAGLYLELDVARGLLAEGFDIQFPDMQGTDTYDIRFQFDDIEGEIECKSLSADAGRKIHRKDFYRLIDSFGQQIAEQAQSSAQIIIVVTLDDRLPKDLEQQRVLRAAVSRALTDAQVNCLEGSFFSVERLPYERYRTSVSAQSGGSYSGWSTAFGPNCHVAGMATESSHCFIVVRSRNEDDHSKSELAALKKATSQLSGNLPGFIAVQFEDIAASDLALSHVRRRSAVLANAIFHSENRGHLSAVYYTAFGGLHHTNGRFAKPAFVFWNPNWRGQPDRLPFRSGVSNSEFAARLGVDRNQTDPDDYLYGTEL